MKYKHCVLHGLRIRRETTQRRQQRLVEYFGKPTASLVFHKLGQYTQTRDGPIQALRGMRSGTQLKDFATAKIAELWICECDTWGELERAASSSHDQPSTRSPT